jgi:hypothetical protein
MHPKDPRVRGETASVMLRFPPAPECSSVSGRLIGETHFLLSHHRGAEESYLASDRQPSHLLSPSTSQAHSAWIALATGPS